MGIENDMSFRECIVGVDGTAVYFWARRERKSCTKKINNAKLTEDWNTGNRTEGKRGRNKNKQINKQTNKQAT